MSDVPEDWDSYDPNDHERSDEPAYKAARAAVAKQAERRRAVAPSDRRAFTEDELKEATQHSSRISPVFGDIAAKMELAAKREIERLLSIGAPIIISRGNGIEEWYSWPPSDGNSVAPTDSGSDLTD